MDGLDRSRRWTKRVDEKLAKIISTFDGRKVCNWNAIAASLNEGKSAKSCRLRWENQLHPDLNHGPVEPGEDEVIVKAAKELGHVWAAIARLLTDRKASQQAQSGMKAPFRRTDNWVKNRWHFHLSGKGPCPKKRKPCGETDPKDYQAPKRSKGEAYFQAVPLPDLPMPDTPLPDLPSQSLPLPDFPLPDIALPDFPQPLPDYSLPDYPLPYHSLPDLSSPAPPLADYPLPALPAAPWAESQVAPMAVPLAGSPAERLEAYMTLLHGDQLHPWLEPAAQPTPESLELGSPR